MNEEYFTTQDMYLAVSLNSLGFTLLSLTEDSFTHKVTFTFAQNQTLKDKVEKYWLRKLKVEPQEMFSCYKSIKNRLNEINSLNRKNSI